MRAPVVGARAVAERERSQHSPGVVPCDHRRAMQAGDVSSVSDAWEVNARNG